MMSLGERRKRAIGWLNIIERDVQSMLTDNFIFWEVQAVIRDNASFEGCSGTFNHWLASSFIQSTATGVRRQAKLNDDSVSLKRLLHEIERFPELISREHYLSHYANAEQWLKELGQRDFDRFAGDGNPCIPAERATRDIAKLEAAVGAIEHYVDRRVAHYDKRGLAQAVPTLNDLARALDELDSLVVKYRLYFTAVSTVTLLPTFQFDWKDVFRFAWEPPNQEAEEFEVS